MPETEQAPHPRDTLSRDTLEGLEALERLYKRYHTVTEAEALEAQRKLLEGTDLEPDLEFAFIHKPKPEVPENPEAAETPETAAETGETPAEQAPAEEAAEEPAPASEETPATSEAEAPEGDAEGKPPE